MGSNDERASHVGIDIPSTYADDQEPLSKRDLVEGNDFVAENEINNPHSSMSKVAEGSDNDKHSEGCAGDSPTECERSCRICQEVKDENVVSIGCNCKGELGTAHPSCASEWFRAKRSNLCEICREPAKNILLLQDSENPQGEGSPPLEFALDRLNNRNQNQNHEQNQNLDSFLLWRGSNVIRFLLLLISVLFMALFVSDVISRAEGGYISLPATIIFGVLSMLGLVAYFRSCTLARRTLHRDSLIALEARRTASRRNQFSSSHDAAAAPRVVFLNHS